MEKNDSVEKIIGEFERIIKLISDDEVLIYREYPYFRNMNDEPVNPLFSIYNHKTGILLFDFFNKRFAINSIRNMLEEHCKTKMEKSKSQKFGNLRVPITVILISENMQEFLIDRFYHYEYRFRDINAIEKVFHDYLGKFPQSITNLLLDILEVRSVVNPFIKRKYRSRNNIHHYLEFLNPDFKSEEKLINNEISPSLLIFSIKAALLHLKYPTKIIGVTFTNQSLYKFIKSLIRDVYRYFSYNRDPDWNFLQIQYIWTIKGKEGVLNEVQELVSEKDSEYEIQYYIRKSHNETLEAIKDISNKMMNKISEYSIKWIYDYLFVLDCEKAYKDFVNLCIKLTDSSRVYVSSSFTQDFPQLRELKISPREEYVDDAVRVKNGKASKANELNFVVQLIKQKKVPSTNLLILDISDDPKRLNDLAYVLNKNNIDIINLVNDDYGNIDLYKDIILISDITKVKGIERDNVIITGIDEFIEKTQLDRERAYRIMYVAKSRARESIFYVYNDERNIGKFLRWNEESRRV